MNKMLNNNLDLDRADNQFNLSYMLVKTEEESRVLVYHTDGMSEDFHISRTGWLETYEESSLITKNEFDEISDSILSVEYCKPNFVDATDVWGYDNIKNQEEV